MEPLIELIECDLAISILVELNEGFVEEVFVECIFTTNLAVELNCNLMDLRLFEET